MRRLPPGPLGRAELLDHDLPLARFPELHGVVLEDNVADRDLTVSGQGGDPVPAYCNDGG